MKRKKLIVLLLFIFPFILNAQKKIITFLDETNKEPIIGLQIFSENGSFIGNPDSTGKFELDLYVLQQGKTKSILAYNSEYSSPEYKLNEVPNFIYLKKNEYIQLEPVVVTARGSKKYFTLNGFFRSWQLVNGKLIKYGDGLIEYHMPYADVNNNFDTGVKSYVTSYRTFKGDSLIQMLRIIKVPPLDGYLGVAYIPKNDVLKRERSRYVVKRSKDNSGEIYKKDKKIGFVVYDENNNPSLINTSTNSEEAEVIKTPFGKVSGKWKEIEKWIGEGNVRHPTYIFNSGKTINKTKVDGKDTNIETITEIFIDDDIIADDKKPENYKTFIVDMQIKPALLVKQHF
jgi:hypothetical protein